MLRYLGLRRPYRFKRFLVAAAVLLVAVAAIAVATWLIAVDELTSVGPFQWHARAQVAGDGRYGWLPLVRDRDVWPIFADNGHFAARDSKRFAQFLAPAVRDACR
jgi:hypothetical protein